MMNTQTIEVTFDGQVFRPDTPPTDLKPNTRLRIHVETPVSENDLPITGNAWDILEKYAGFLKNMPPDWSERHDHYLSLPNTHEETKPE